MALIDGTDGNDRLTGSNEDDTLIGRAGNDVLNGRGGNDSYYLGEGQDTVVLDVRERDRRTETDRILDFDPAEDILDLRSYNISSLDTALVLSGVVGSSIEIYTRGQIDILVIGAGTQLSGANFRLSQRDAPDILIGGKGADDLFGGLGNDSLFGGSGGEGFLSDRLFGEQGDDTLDAGAGRDDRVFGGPGADLFVASADQRSNRSSDVTVVMDFSAAEGDRVDLRGYRIASFETVLELGGETSLLASGAEREWAIALGTPGALDGIQISGIAETSLRPQDFVLSTAVADDTIRGTQQTDLEVGGLGNDWLVGRGGFDRLFGEGGNDTIVGGEGADDIHGGEGDDRLRGGAGFDTLFGGDGDDTLDAGPGGAELTGGAGRDRFMFTVETTASSTSDMIRVRDFEAGPGGDVVGLRGLRIATLETVRALETLAPDLSEGWSLEVKTAGTTDRFVLLGVDGAGLDADNFLLSIEVSDDTVQGSEASDYLFGGLGDDVLSGGSGEDALFGEQGNDCLTGGNSLDTLYGGDGNDTLTGDFVEGGTGDDRLTGETGDIGFGGTPWSNVLLTGGAGRDTFVFATRLNGASNNTTVLDFAPGVGGDFLDLSGLGFASVAEVLSVGENSFSQGESGWLLAIPDGIFADNLFLARVSEASLIDANFIL